jgi:hypothetical protein
MMSSTKWSAMGAVWECLKHVANFPVSILPPSLPLCLLSVAPVGAISEPAPTVYHRRWMDDMWMDDMWMDGMWMDGMWCGKASRRFGSRTGSGFKPGSKNQTRLGFYFGLMRIGTSDSNWPSQVTRPTLVQTIYLPYYLPTYLLTNCLWVVSK